MFVVDSGNGLCADCGNDVGNEFGNVFGIEFWQWCW